ncbi:Hypothetical predicted protein [Olea europaea subsp. europaea]|uniref:Uncharacterized protein n=1 Tax=Olea europaea subsp. europaea TaxID=158383 RepID=A0A8S0RFI1_OLEEU|nr:Hypothetical predicted protein [Olea europaea subsp. europaea]
MNHSFKVWWQGHNHMEIGDHFVDCRHSSEADRQSPSKCGQVSCETIVAVRNVSNPLAFSPRKPSSHRCFHFKILSNLCYLQHTLSTVVHPW